MANFNRTPAVLIFLISVSLRLSAYPGEIISLEYERTYTPDQIISFTAALYEGYEQPQPEYVVDVYQLVFESTYPDGSPAPAYAQVFLPRFGSDKDEIRSLYVFAPGSTGLIDNCRASREHEAGIRWGLYRAHVLSHAGLGTIGIQPDYLGFRDPEQYQYYMVARAEAAVLLDSIRVMRPVFDRLKYTGVASTVNFAGGFSQGGHAILAAADENADYAADVTLHGVIGYGATANPARLMLEYPSVAPMMIYTYWRLYGEDAVDPWTVFRSEYADYLEDDVLSQCVGAMSAYYPHHPEDLYTPDFYRALRENSLQRDFPEIARVMAENTTGYRSRETEILLLQGTDDIVIFPETQREYVRELQSAGIPVTMSIYEGVRHDTRQAGFEEAREWMAALTLREGIAAAEGLSR
jgi:predicted esterase